MCWVFSSHQAPVWLSTCPLGYGCKHPVKGGLSVRGDQGKNILDRSDLGLFLVVIVSTESVVAVVYAFLDGRAVVVFGCKSFYHFQRVIS